MELALRGVCLEVPHPWAEGFVGQSHLYRAKEDALLEGAPVVGTRSAVAPCIKWLGDVLVHVEGAGEV